MVGGAYTHLDDMIASQYQSIDCAQHTYCQSISIGWGNLLAPENMDDKTSHETSVDLDNCFNHHLGLISRPWATLPMNEHQWCLNLVSL